jgi:hypothetical protein
MSEFFLIDSSLGSFSFIFRKLSQHTKWGKMFSDELMENKFSSFSWFIFHREWHEDKRVGKPREQESLKAFLNISTTQQEKHPQMEAKNHFNLFQSHSRETETETASRRLAGHECESELTASCCWRAKVRRLQMLWASFRLLARNATPELPPPTCGKKITENSAEKKKVFAVLIKLSRYEDSFALLSSSRCSLSWISKMLIIESSPRPRRRAGRKKSKEQQGKKDENFSVIKSSRSPVKRSKSLRVCAKAFVSMAAPWPRRVLRLSLGEN